MDEGEHLQTAKTELVEGEHERTPKTETVDAQGPFGRRLAASPTAKGLKRGDAIGRYVILEALGEGGMAVVYAAYDPTLDRKVALKLAQAGIEAEARARLVREAQALARLSHPNVVTVHDVGDDGGQIFIAMEFVRGVTLAEWARAQPRNWREILSVFVEAGRGLAAAHAVGIVHRDFKPGNVLVGEDGRLRVFDFGLAVGEPDGAPRSTGASPSVRPSDVPVWRTAVGTVMGTPAYMAPEQWRGAATDARTDQFSFCVALHQALYRQLPFAGESSKEIAKNVREGVMRELPKDTVVPTWVARAVMRGLKVAPEQRYPSMMELLAKLDDDPARARRRRLVGAAVSAVVVVAGVGATAAVVHGRIQAAAVCEGANERLSGVWDAGRKDAVLAAFDAVEKPFARDAYPRVEKALDTYAHAWVAMRTQSCTATRIRGEQSAELMDLRAACLDRRLDELRAQVDLFARADERVVENSVRAVSALTGLDVCANVVSLRAPVPEPTDPAARATIAGVRKQLAAAKALDEGGKYDEGIAIARPAAADARATGYGPLEAEAFHQLGSLQIRAEDAHAAEETLEEAWLAAEASRDDAMAASSLSLLVDVVGYVEARPTEGLALSRHAVAVIDRMGGDDDLLAAVQQYVASVYYAQGQYEQALASDKESILAWERSHGSEDRHLAMVLSNEANALDSLGRLEEALAAYEHAVTIDEGALGASHPDLALILGNMGELLLHMHRTGEAIAVLRRSLSIFERTLGPDHLDAAYPLNDLGWVLLASGHYDEALESFQHASRIFEEKLGRDRVEDASALTGVGLALLGRHRPTDAIDRIERAMTILDAHPGDPVAVADAQFALARALGDLHREPKRARDLAKKAREAYVAAGARAAASIIAVADVDAWLAAAP